MESLLLDPPAARAEEATLAALLRCCVREVAGVRGLVWSAPPYLLLRVAGTLVRVRAHGGAALRFEGAPERLADGAWVPLTSGELVRLTSRELSGHNPEFSGQVATSREAIAAILRARAEAAPPADPWLVSEQSLVYGHPFHPSPKAHGGTGWLRFAPEAHAEFPLRLLGVPEELVRQEGDPGALDLLGTAPPGHVLLPAHPWQVELLKLDDRLLDLGETSWPVSPTSSVRTVYDPVSEKCLKFSLDVRITNCVRKNAWYELAGAVELTRRLEPVFAALGTKWLPEPGYRTTASHIEGLGVIVRESPWAVCTPGLTPTLAGALALGVETSDPLAWWSAYVSAVALPVLDAYFTHGVVLEPHLQNVLVAMDDLPREAIFRDLEGTKLVAGRHDLSGLDPAVASALTYDAERGWSRVVYCLVVNHLTEIAAALAGHDDDLLRTLWQEARRLVAEYAGEIGWPVRLSDLLAGEPLPAKANLTVRWARHADRSAGYVPIGNPFA
ncbi:IucA/IucC family protein [Nonomuraea sp. NPDC050663]|uniref:IucA/IucC family protein n=1 Tax=Nonomuraea sp. NPDC050663 TaxID=3364370 RepID=UPI00379225FE